MGHGTSVTGFYQIQPTRPTLVINIKLEVLPSLVALQCQLQLAAALLLSRHHLLQPPVHLRVGADNKPNMSSGLLLSLDTKILTGLA